MEETRAEIFQMFAEKAKAKIEERKKRNTKTVYVGAIDQKITLRGLSDVEFNECNEYSQDGITNDKYTLYRACKDLQELASYMKEEQMIKTELEVVEMFSTADRTKLVNIILELSGFYDKTTVKEDEEVKN